MNSNFSKDVSQETLKKIYTSIVVAIGIMIYFIVLNLAYNTMKSDRLIGDIEVFSGAFLVIGIYLLEKAYKKDSGTLAISAIEAFVLSIHSLTIMHVITMLNFDFRLYLLTSSYLFAIYYILKSIFIYTKGRRDYERTFSDIPEIVKKDEPKKKEATKKKKTSEDETNKSEDKVISIENQKKTNNIDNKKKKTNNKEKKEDQKTKNGKNAKKEKVKEEKDEEESKTEKSKKTKKTSKGKKQNNSSEEKEQVKLDKTSNKRKSKKNKKEE